MDCEPPGFNGWKVRTSSGGSVERLASDHYRLEVPAGGDQDYRLAQLDDYKGLRRSQFKGQPPQCMSLVARVSSSDAAGTWGFGFWNDPMAISFGLKGGDRKLPALPNAVWYFFASPQNHLAFNDENPGYGFLASVYKSSKVPLWLFLPGVPALPLLLAPGIAKRLRSVARTMIQEDIHLLELDVMEKHHYQIDWKQERVDFRIDGKVWFTTAFAPVGKLGFVLWVDNQYAKFTPQGKLGYGVLASSSPFWLEVEDLSLSNSSPT